MSNTQSSGTGPQHYQAAHELLVEVDGQIETGMTDSVTPMLLAKAQVHATLALAAATAQQFLVNEFVSGEDYGTAQIGPDAREWISALGGAA